MIDKTAYWKRILLVWACMVATSILTTIALARVKPPLPDLALMYIAFFFIAWRLVKVSWKGWR